MLFFASQTKGATCHPGILTTYGNTVYTGISTGIIGNCKEEVYASYNYPPKTQEKVKSLTGNGSTTAIKPIEKFLKNWGIHRVYSLGIRMFTDKWDKMPEKKQKKQENRLRNAAKKFYYLQKKKPYISSIVMYHMNKFVIKKYVGKGNYPYEYWKENGYFDKCPL